MNPEVCSGSRENQETISHNHVYDAIFVLPTYPFPQEPVTSGWKDGSGIVERIVGLPLTSHRSGLWIDTRLKDLTAALMVQHGDTDTIITMSRSIRPWMKQSYADLMENDVKYFLQYLSQDVSKTKFVQENLNVPDGGSFDLMSEVLIAKDMAKQYKFKQIAFISDQEHAKRVRKILSKYQQPDEDIAYNVIEMETILSAKSDYLPDKVKRIPEMINSLHTSPFWTFWTVRELLARQAMEYVSKMSKITR